MSPSLDYLLQALISARKMGETMPFIYDRYGFGAYFNVLPGSEWSALMLTYGFPLAIIGMALKYAELKLVKCLTYSDAQNLREKCATPILKQESITNSRHSFSNQAGFCVF